MKYSLDALDLSLAGSASGAFEALDPVARLQPDVVLYDVAKSPIDRIHLIQSIRAASETTEVLVLGTDTIPGYIKHIFWYGARGYILHDDIECKLRSALRSVAAGRRYLSVAVQKTARVDRAPENQLLLERESV